MHCNIMQRVEGIHIFQVGGVMLHGSKPKAAAHLKPISPLPQELLLYQYMSVSVYACLFSCVLNRTQLRNL